MNLGIYAIRDRLIDYFMQPFVGPDDKQVLASVARLVNTGEVTSDIAQAPHQFEVWKLGEVNDEGHVIPERKYLQDCSSLVRRDLRQRGQPGGPEAQNNPRENTEAAGGAGPPGRAPARALPDQAPPEKGPADEVRPGPQGGFTVHDYG